MKYRSWCMIGGAMACVLASGVLHSEPMPGLLSRLANDDYSPVLRSFVMLSALAFLPLMVIALTSFTRIIVVLSLLRSALGLQQTPPNSVLLTLAIFLTLFSMNPVFEAAKQSAIDPYSRHENPRGRGDRQRVRAFQALHGAPDSRRRFARSGANGQAADAEIDR